MGKLLCYLGLHKWAPLYVMAKSKQPLNPDMCERCFKQRSY